MNIGMKLYYLDEIINAYNLEKENTMSELNHGYAMSDEDVVDLIITEILKNDKNVTSHILINFPRNESQSVLFENKLSGYTHIIY